LHIEHYRYLIHDRHGLQLHKALLLFMDEGGLECDTRCSAFRWRWSSVLKHYIAKVRNIIWEYIGQWNMY